MKWIRTNIKLPDICKDVLLYEYTGVILVGYYGTDDKWADSIDDKWIDSNVTHWQPLPDPPKPQPKLSDIWNKILDLEEQA